MPRISREVEIGIPMHITQRGNRRKNMFIDQDDKEFYILAFQKYKRKFKVKLYAWCLMDNHVHFILEPSSLTGVSKLFSHLNNKYVSYFNKKYNKEGRLLQGRFYSCLITEDNLYEAIRYVELNPVRAKMVKLAGGYEWSSAKEHLELRNRFYLSSLPNYLMIPDWWEYLALEDYKEDVWETLRLKTISSKKSINSCSEK